MEERVRQTFCRLVAKVGLTILLFGLWGCSPYVPKDGITIDAIDHALDIDTYRPDVDVPPEVDKALLPPIEFYAATRQHLQDNRFDVIVDEVPAKEFFIGLVEGTPYNVIVHPTVAGNITLHLKNVSVPEVLDIVREMYGYDYVATDYGYKLLPYGLRSQLFHINYLNVFRKGESEILVSAGQVTDVDKNQLPIAPSAQDRSKKAGTRIQTTSESDFWPTLVETLEFIIGDEDGRAVIANPQAGVILVKAMPKELMSVQEYLQKTQLSVQKQVVLEAKILEVELHDGFNAGIDWTLVINGNSLDNTTLRQGLTDDIRLGELPVDKIGEALGGIFSAAFDFEDFQALIEMLSTQGNVQVLSSPKVAAVNNQKAVIRVGNDEFFVTDIDFTNEESDNNDNDEEQTDITLTPFFSGIALDVTPQIGNDDYITLHIHPSVSEVVDQNKEIIIRDRPIKLPLAFSSIRESDTIVRARDGEIIVIGGLIQDSMRESISAIPFLGEIPFFGAMFRQTQQEAKKSELVILLRAKIVEENVFNKELQASRDRFGNLRRGFHYGGKVKRFGNLAEFE